MTKKRLGTELFDEKGKRRVTFTSFDIIRIACLNLEKEELRMVILFFMIGVPVIVGTELIDVFFKKFKVPKTLLLGLKWLLNFLIKKSIIDILRLAGFTFSNNDLEVLYQIMLRLRKFYGIT